MHTHLAKTIANMNAIALKGKTTLKKHTKIDRLLAHMYPFFGKKKVLLSVLPPLLHHLHPDTFVVRQPNFANNFSHTQIHRKASKHCTWSISMSI